MLKRIREKYKERIGKLGESETLNKPINLQSFVSLDTLKKLKIAYIPYNELLKEGFFAGLGWAFGVTVGFVVVSTIIVAFFQFLGGLPFIGGFVADLVAETQSQLLKRTPFIPQ